MDMTAVLLIYGLMSAVAFGLYWIDKQRAVAVSGGLVKRRARNRAARRWPGALIAQRVFHHKGKKTRYLAVFWMMA